MTISFDNLGTFPGRVFGQSENPGVSIAGAFQKTGSNSKVKQYLADVIDAHNAKWGSQDGKKNVPVSNTVIPTNTV